MFSIKSSISVVNVKVLCDTKELQNFWRKKNYTLPIYITSSKYRQIISTYISISNGSLRLHSEMNYYSKNF